MVFAGGYGSVCPGEYGSCPVGTCSNIISSARMGQSYGNTLEGMLGQPPAKMVMFAQGANFVTCYIGKPFRKCSKGL